LEPFPSAAAAVVQALRAMDDESAPPAAATIPEMKVIEHAAT
jgi:hypothetical protein